MSEACDHAFSPMLSLQNSSAATAAHSTDSDSTKRQRTAEHAPCKFCRRKRQSKEMAKLLCQAQPPKRPSTNRLHSHHPSVMLGKTIFGGIPTRNSACLEALSLRPLAEPGVLDTDGAETAPKLRAVSHRTSIAKRSGHFDSQNLTHSKSNNTGNMTESVSSRRNAKRETVESVGWKRLRQLKASRPDWGVWYPGAALSTRRRPRNMRAGWIPKRRGGDSQSVVQLWNGKLAGRNLRETSCWEWTPMYSFQQVLMESPEKKFIRMCGKRIACIDGHPNCLWISSRNSGSESSIRTSMMIRF